MKSDNYNRQIPTTLDCPRRRSLRGGLWCGRSLTSWTQGGGIDPARWANALIHWYPSPSPYHSFAHRCFRYLKMYAVCPILPWLLRLRPARVPTRPTWRLPQNPLWFLRTTKKDALNPALHKPRQATPAGGAHAEGGQEASPTSAKQVHDTSSSHLCLRVGRAWLPAWLGAACPTPESASFLVGFGKPQGGRPKSPCRPTKRAPAGPTPGGFRLIG